MVTASTIVLTATERVTLGQPAATAIATEAERLGAQRVFILSGVSLNRNTEEIRRIEAALGSRHTATHDGIQPHAPRGDVLAAANAARAANADLIVTVGGGSVTDAGKIVTILLKHDVTTVEDFDAFRTHVDADGTVISAGFRCARRPRDLRAHDPFGRRVQLAVGRHRRDDQAQAGLRAPHDGARSASSSTPP